MRRELGAVIEKKNAEIETFRREPERDPHTKTGRTVLLRIHLKSTFQPLPRGRGKAPVCAI